MDDKFEAELDNTKEWIRSIRDDIKEIKLDQRSMLLGMENLKVKVAIISGSVSIFVTAIATIIARKI